MKILYATDGSRGALAAAELLNALPLDTDDMLTILTVITGDWEEEGREALEAARAAFSHSTAGRSTHIHSGNPTEEILRAAEQQRSDLVVLGASGRSALTRFFLGSVAERVARHASCPVLLARPLRHGLRELIVGVDGSSGAARAAAWLEHLPLPVDALIRLLTVLPRVEDLTRTSRLLPLPLMGQGDAEAFLEREREEAQAGLDRLAASFSAAGRRAVTDIRRGDPASALLEAADSEGADLLVVGSHGYSAIERFLMGSVSEKLLRHAPCSVLVVR